MKLDDNAAPVQHPEYRSAWRDANQTSTVRNQSASHVTCWGHSGKHRWTCHMWRLSPFTYIWSTSEVDVRYEQEERRQPEKPNSTWPPGVQGRLGKLWTSPLIGRLCFRLRRRLDFDQLWNLGVKCRNWSCPNTNAALSVRNVTFGVTVAFKLADYLAVLQKNYKIVL